MCTLHDNIDWHSFNCHLPSIYQFVWCVTVWDCHNWVQHSFTTYNFCWRKKRQRKESKTMSAHTYYMSQLFIDLSSMRLNEDLNTKKERKNDWT